MYHSVSELAIGPLRTLAVPPRRLAEQLGALVGAGYRLVGLTEALDLFEAAGESPLVALTFDDGYANFLTEAVPLLAEAGASATLYPSVGHLGNGPASWLGRWAASFGPLLTWSQLREVAASGRVEIGNHGLHHHPLDVLPTGSLAHEVAASRDRLEQELGTETRSFCYPHGYHDRHVRTLVRRAGYQNACEVGRRSYQPTVDNRLAVPRLQPTPDHSGADLLTLVRGGGPRLMPQVKRLAQPAWRITRRVARRYGRQLT